MCNPIRSDISTFSRGTVPRDVIIQDYLLSMRYRRPQREFEKLDPTKYPGNSFVEFVAKTRTNELFSRPILYDPAGEPFLEHAFNEIDQRWVMCCTICRRSSAFIRRKSFNCEHSISNRLSWLLYAAVVNLCLS